LGDTRTPVIVAATDLLVFISLALSLRGPLGHVGISIAVTGASAAQMSLLWLLLRRRLADVRFGEVVASGARTLLATLPAAACGVLTARSVGHMLAGGALERLVPAIAGATVFGVTFLGLAWIVRCQELRTIAGVVTRRLDKSA
jgi:putative peptidoglycan lipid II flippase